MGACLAVIALVQSRVLAQVLVLILSHMPTSAHMAINSLICLRLITPNCDVPAVSQLSAHLHWFVE